MFLALVGVLPEGACPKLGHIVVAEVNLHQDFQVVESTLVDRLIVIVVISSFFIIILMKMIIDQN